MPRGHRLAVAPRPAHRAWAGQGRRPPLLDTWPTTSWATICALGDAAAMPVRACSNTSATSSAPRRTQDLHGPAIRHLTPPGTSKWSNSSSTARRFPVGGSMVMQAADAAGRDHSALLLSPKLSIAANCRMCLVDVEKAPKPMPACATPVTAGMVVLHADERRGQGAAVGDGVPAHQPPVGLPDLRPGRRVPAAGPWRSAMAARTRATLPKKSACVHKNRGPAGLDGRDEPLHPLHALRPLRPGDRRGDGTRHAQPGETAEITSLHRPRSIRTVGQHDRRVPGGRSDQQAFRSARHLGTGASQGISPRFHRAPTWSCRSRTTTVMRVVPLENEAVNECWLQTATASATKV